MLVTGAVFSFAQGVIHTYYTVALAPAIAALVGIGAALVWRNRDSLAARVLGAAGVLSSALWAEALMARTPAFYPWLRPVIVCAGSLSAVALVAAPFARRISRRGLLGAAVLGLVACLAGPLAFTATTVATAHTGSVPSAGPSTAGPGGAGTFAGGPGHRTANLSGRAAGASSGALRGGTAPSGTGALNGGAPPSGTGAPRGGTAPSGTGGSFEGRSNAQPPSQASQGGGSSSSAAPSALVAALKSDAASYRWVAATSGSQSAATLELATGGDPVMAIGGFDGEGGNVTLDQFKSYVAKHEIHYFIASGGGGFGAGPGGSTSAIANWVSTRFKGETIGGQTVYDLAAGSK